jgi:hypothetical protein
MEALNADRKIYKMKPEQMWLQGEHWMLLAQGRLKKPIVINMVMNYTHQFCGHFYCSIY